MPSFCAVFKCSNRHDRERDKSYYRLPKVIIHQGDRTRELSHKRREKWIAAIGRADLKPCSYDNLRICSDHFINKPADLYQELDPDWVPTVNMGYKPVLLTPSPKKSRYNRSLNRSSKKQTLVAAETLLDLRCSVPDDQIEPEPETGTASQTDMEGISLVSAMDSELIRLQEENAILKQTLDRQKFDLPFFKENDANVKYYTGLINFTVLMSLYNYVESAISSNRKSALNKFQQLLLVLMKLRLNASNQDLAVRFGVSDSTISRVFNHVLDVLHAYLQPLIVWPEREQLKKTMPMSFRTHFGTKVAVIIDCFEIAIERPSNLRARCETWSNYKHSNTAKYLIGVTPQGSISFISNGYGGRASDRRITEDCGILMKLVPGDLVLADRGFDIQDCVGTIGAQVYIPAFTKGKTQLGALDVERTRRIANSRIHVERVIGVVRQKFSILSSRISHDFLMSDSHEDLPLDKIVLTCCGLTNLCDSVVSFN